MMIYLECAAPALPSQRSCGRVLLTFLVVPARLHFRQPSVPRPPPDPVDAATSLSSLFYSPCLDLAPTVRPRGITPLRPGPLPPSSRATWSPIYSGICLVVVVSAGPVPKELPLFDLVLSPPVLHHRGAPKILVFVHPCKHPLAARALSTFLAQRRSR